MTDEDPLSSKQHYRKSEAKEHHLLSLGGQSNRRKSFGPNHLRLKKRTNLEMGDVMQLCEFILTITSFMFSDTIYRLKFDTAMRSSVSPTVVNLFIDFLNKKLSLDLPFTEENLVFETVQPGPYSSFDCFLCS